MQSLFSEKNLLKVIKIGLYAALLTPFLTIQKFMFPFITSKVFIFNILVEIILASWLILIILYPQYRPKLKSLSITLLSFFGILILSSALGADINRSFWSTQERAIGVFTFIHFLAFFFTLSALSAEEWKKYIKFSVLASVVMSLFAIVQLYNSNLILQNSGPVVDRPGSFFGNAAFLATYLLFNIFLSLWLSFESFMKNNGKKVFQWLYLAAGIFEIGILVFLTETRGAMLGLLAGFIALLVYFAFKGQVSGYGVNLKKYSKFILAGILVFAAIFFFTKGSPVWQKVPGLNRLADISLTDATTQTRFIAWNMALESFSQKPVLGYGWENFKYPFDKNYDPRLMRFGFGETYWDKPHNVILEHMISGGILGILSYLSIFFFAAYYLLRRRDHGDLESAKPFFLAILSAYFIQNLFLFDTFGSYLMFFMFLAFVAGNYDGDKKEAISSGGSTRGRKIISVLILLAMIAPIVVNAKILSANNRQYWIANYYANSMQDKAIEAYHSARDRFNPYLDQTYADFSSLTVDLYNQGKLDNAAVVLKEAISAIDAAIGRKPNNFSYYLNLADAANNTYAFSPKQLFAISESSIKKAFELSPKRQQIYYTYSKLKLLQGKKDEAVGLLKEAVGLDPESGDPHFIYGLFLLETKDSKNGLAEIEKAAELGRAPRSADEYRIIGNYYGDLEMYTKAIESYKQALALNPGDIDAGLKLGIVYYYAGDNKNAKFLFSQILNGMPEFRDMPGYKQIEPILKDLGIF